MESAAETQSTAAQLRRKYSSTGLVQAPLTTLNTRLLCVVIGLSFLLQHSAVVHHQTRLLSTALQRWRDRRQSRVVASQHMMRALHHYLYKFKRKVWAAWTKVGVPYATG